MGKGMGQIFLPGGYLGQSPAVPFLYHFLINDPTFNIGIPLSESYIQKYGYLALPCLAFIHALPLSALWFISVPLFHRFWPPIQIAFLLDVYNHLLKKKSGRLALLCLAIAHTLPLTMPYFFTCFTL